jgi:hypothetical protein
MNGPTSSCQKVLTWPGGTPVPAMLKRAISGMRVRHAARGTNSGCGATWQTEQCLRTLSTNAASGSVSGLPSSPRTGCPAG